MRNRQHLAPLPALAHAPDGLHATVEPLSDVVICGFKHAKNEKGWEQC
jgi:hypothetical protein